ncbi:hypothetical protein GCM10027052_08590 [Parafrigoribacterium mesophilum]
MRACYTIATLTTPRQSERSIRDVTGRRPTDFAHSCSGTTILDRMIDVLR